MTGPTKPNNDRAKAPFILLPIFAGLVIFTWLNLPVLNETIRRINATQTPAEAIRTSASFEQAGGTDSPLLAATFDNSSEPVQAQSIADQNGVIVLSMSDGGYFHLFAYHPESLPLSRLTDSPWDDIDPALSPDGKQIAFSSRRNGYWDIYIWDLASGDLLRVTDTAEYEGHPCWSPDGQWLAYETYAQGNLDISIQAMHDLDEAPVQLTDDPGQDYSPAWSSEGRMIAFVSTRSGDADIWTAQLDQVEDRFTNISLNSGSEDDEPAWSPDGTRLAWSGQSNGAEKIFVQDVTQPESLPAARLFGRSPTWAPTGEGMLVAQITGSQPAMAGFNLNGAQLEVPLTNLPGALHGITWGAGSVETLIGAHLKESPAQFSALVNRTYTFSTIAKNERFGMVAIDDLDVPYPYLQDSVDESFLALRNEVARQTGWDVLGSLENAYVPLTEAPNPGSIDEWLQTGRGISINPLPIQAGWLAVVREDREGQTYWRMYARARYQDGSQGIPLKSRPWSIELRYSGDPQAYEAGGGRVDIPTGYWVDLTELAARYDWLALPALQNWRTYAPAGRYTQFACTDGLDWSSAMAQIYPAEALSVPTALPTFTITPSLTPTIRFYRSATPEPSPTPTTAPTRRPTWTPMADTSAP